MRMLNRIAAVVLLAVVGVSAGGCATKFGQQLSSIADAASSTKVDAGSILIASNAFDAVQVTAENYLRLPRCTASSTPVCRDSRATKPLLKAVRAGRDARDAAQDFLRSHPGELGPRGLYDALTGSVGLIQQIFTTYNVEATVR